MTRKTRATLLAAGIGLLATGCVAPLGSGDDPQIETVSSELQGRFDLPPEGAAVKVLVGTARHSWVFGCNRAHGLEFAIKPESAMAFVKQPLLDTTCVGRPAVARWDQGSFSIVKVYGNYTDGHLWELVFPDSRFPDQFSWNDLSAVTFFGTIVGSPIIADVGAAGDVSVLVKMPGNFLNTFDFFDQEWSTRPLLYLSGDTMRTQNWVSAQTSAAGVPILAGRGADDSNDTQGWMARRTGSWANTYVNYRGLNNGGTLAGTPAVYNGRVYAAFGTDRQLKSRAVTALTNAAWTDYGPGCKLGGSPMAAPEIVPSSFNGVEAYARSANGNLLWWHDGGGGCGFDNSFAGDLGSAPGWVLGDTGPVAGIRADFDFIYTSATSQELMYYSTGRIFNTKIFLPRSGVTP